MRNKTYLTTLFKIILLGIVGIIFTYLPDHLREFFGDHASSTNYNDYYYTYPSGYFWIGIALLVLSILKIFTDALKLEDKGDKA